MIYIKKIIFCFFILFAVVCFAETKLKLGSIAPELEIYNWIKGEKINLKKGKDKNIFVIEFWATWCPPCRDSIPHLTKIQKKFKNDGVVVIGISSEDSEDVIPFVEKMSNQMDYTVALDNNFKTSKLFMKSFGVRGIPHAFVVDKKGRIVWHGHPADNLESILEELVAGTFNLQKRLNIQKIDRLMSDYFEMTQLTGSTNKLIKLGNEVLELIKNDNVLLNQFAWTILTHPKIVIRDKKMALQAAELANKLTDNKNIEDLYTYSLALFENGKMKELTKTLKKSASLINTEDEKTMLIQQIADFMKNSNFVAACAEEKSCEYFVENTNQVVRVGSWNMDYWESNKIYGAEGKSVDDMAGYILDANISVFAMQEVCTDGDAKLLKNRKLDEIFDVINNKTDGDWHYLIFKNLTDFNQHVGVAWDTKKVKLIDEMIVPVKHGEGMKGKQLWYRPPHALKFSTGSNLTDFVVIPVHHKSNWGGDFATHRELESRELADALPAVKNKLNDDDIIIIGRLFEDRNGAGAKNYLDAGFIDFNPSDEITYSTRMSLARVYVAAGQPEFQNRTFDVLGFDWMKKNDLLYEAFYEKFSDYFIIATDVTVLKDDD